MPGWVRADQVPELADVVVGRIEAANVDDELPEPSPTEPWYFHIALGRHVMMTVLCAGLYEPYWMYRNWLYVRRHDDFRVQPLMRAWLWPASVYGLLARMRDDRRLASVGAPKLASGPLVMVMLVTLAAMWIFGAEDSSMADVVTPMCFVANTVAFALVQRHLNRANAARHPRPRHAPWTAGQFVCLLAGLLINGIFIYIGFRMALETMPRD